MFTTDSCPRLPEQDLNLAIHPVDGIGSNVRFLTAPWLLVVLGVIIVLMMVAVTIVLISLVTPSVMPGFSFIIHIK